MNPDILNVYYENTLVGQLWRDTAGYIGFGYEQSWINNGFSISQQLPLTAKEYSPSEGKAHQFFANLLPEAGARMHIVRDLKTTNSDFELLKAIGGECAGALSILPTGYKINTQANYKNLNHKEFKKLLQRKGNIFNFTTDKQRPRLSLAGAQDKCPIFFDDNHYYLPQDTAPSSHILKFEITDYRHIPAYEYFLGKLANSIGLPIVESQLKNIDTEYFLLIKRYDRILTNKKKIQRLHQEDFCQALGINYGRKYQQDGGPTFCDCFKLIQNISTNPIIDAENLLKWQIFNVLAGNSDGHAKNLALIYNEKQQISLAPFYDLVCTRAVERIDANLAMSVGGEFNPSNITIKHWEYFANECDINQKFLLALLRSMSKTLPENAIKIKTEFENQHGSYPALQRIQMVVTKQCNKTLKILSK